MIEKVFKNIGFIECLVKLAHIKNILYIQGVAKISNCYKNITQSLKSAIIIYYRKITNDNS
jgi:ERCC4-related helicase